MEIVESVEPFPFCVLPGRQWRRSLLIHTGCAGHHCTLTPAAHGLGLRCRVAVDAVPRGLWQRAQLARGTVLCTAGAGAKRHLAI